MPELFSEVVGQDMAVSLLTRALQEGAAHAYLFSGPAGVGKTVAAVDFAAGLACSLGGCGTCAACRRVRQGLHPDVEVVTPEGAFIRKEEITDINLHAAYRPFEARAKVYVFLEAENFNLEAANAFLKTLEEPPPHVYFLLVADHPERLLPTIVSRCQLVAFAPVARQAIAKDLESRFGLSEAEAGLLARIAGGNLTYARELASLPSARRQREELLDLARDLPAGGLMALQCAVDEVMTAVERRAEERVKGLEAQLQQALEWAGDARTRSWLTKRHEEKARRQQRRLTTQGLYTVTRICATWYRDLAAVAVGAEGAVFNEDRLSDLRRQARPGALGGYLEAILAVRETEERLRYNVDARLAIASMFQGIKEALNQWPLS